MDTYEQKYKEAIERARRVNNGELTITPDKVQDFNVYEYIFPELRESEDDRIKRCIQVALTDVDEKRFNDYDTTLKDCLFWLEKQGELVEYYEDKLDRCACESFDKGYKAALEKQDEQRTIVNESPSKEMILAVWELGNIWKELTKGSSCTEYGTQLQYIQKHWNESGYYEKLQGEQKPSWSEEDEKMKSLIINTLTSMGTLNLERYHYMNLDEVKNWLKSLKPQPRWKPTKQNIKDLEWCADLVKDKMGVGSHRLQVFIDELKNI